MKREELGNNVVEKLGNFVYTATKGVQNTFQSTIGMITNFIKNSAQLMRESFNKVLNEFTSTIEHIFGDLYTYFMIAFNFAKGVFGKILGVFKKDEDDKQVSAINKIYNFLRQKEKKEFAKGLKKDKDNMFDTIFPFLYIVVASLGSVLGSVIGTILYPFKVLAKTLKILSPITTVIKKLSIGLWNSIESLKGISVIGRFFSKLGWITTVFKKILNNPIFNLFKKFFNIGMRKAPIFNFLFGVWDFFKGFNNAGEDATMFEKVKEGIRSAIHGFIDLPLKFVGWLGDKFLGLFGIKIEDGIGQRLIKAIDKVFDFDYSNIIDIISDGISNIMDWISEKFSSILEKLNPLNWWKSKDELEQKKARYKIDRDEIKGIDLIQTPNNVYNIENNTFLNKKERKELNTLKTSKERSQYLKQIQEDKEEQEARRRTVKKAHEKIGSKRDVKINSLSVSEFNRMESDQRFIKHYATRYKLAKQRNDINEMNSAQQEIQSIKSSSTYLDPSKFGKIYNSTTDSIESIETDITNKKKLSRAIKRKTSEETLQETKKLSKQIDVNTSAINNTNNAIVNNSQNTQSTTDKKINIPDENGMLGVLFSSKCAGF